MADLLAVSRQSVSNWELDQSIPTIDKASQMAKLYHISLGDLLDHEIVVAHKENKRDIHVLKRLINKTCTLDCYDMDLWLDSVSSKQIKVLDINEDWVKIEYERVKKGALIKKEKVVKLIELSSVKGFSRVGDE